MVYVYLLIAIICEVIATTSLKAANGFTVLVPSIIVVISYACAFYFLSLSLSTIPLGIAYSIWAGLGIVFISILSYFIYNQSLDLAAILGMSLIICGVIVIKAFSKSM